MKLTLDQINAEIKNDAQLSEKELRLIASKERCEQKNKDAKNIFSSHPYYGLADDRGFLTRYPANYCTLPRNWVELFLKEGGRFYYCHNWGISPNADNLSTVNPIHLVKAAKLLGRYDYLFPVDIHSIYSQYEPKTRAEYHRCERGFNRSRHLKNFKIETKRSILSLGWMTEEKFAKFFFKNVADENVTFGDQECCGFYAENEILDNVKHWAVTHLRNCHKKYRIRNKRSYIGYAGVRHLVKSKTVARYMANKRSSSMTFREFSTITPYFNSYGTTSEGMMYFGAGLVFVEKKELSTRPFGGGQLAKVGKHFFIFSNDFTEHVEGLDLKETLQVWLSKKKKGGLSFSLNNVRNDRKGTAAFCLYGTKTFLKNRMPFVYRLIKEYQNWSDIPKRIMQTEWELASHDIFEGYPHP